MSYASQRKKNNSPREGAVTKVGQGGSARGALQQASVEAPLYPGKIVWAGFLPNCCRFVCHPAGLVPGAVFASRHTANKVLAFAAK
jgi:hypothetical protein